MRAHLEAVQTCSFVPDFGFRPAGTRVLSEAVETAVGGTTLSLTAAAATPDHTELLVEWIPPERPVGPDNWVVKIDRSGLQRRPAVELEATLIVEGRRYSPTAVENRFGSATGYDMRALTFPPLPGDVDAAELVVGDDSTDVRVRFALTTNDFRGKRVFVSREHAGVTFGVTAVAATTGRIAVELEARTPRPAYVTTIGTGGGPVAFPARLKMAPRRRPRYPLVLEDGQGRRSEEVTRMQNMSAASQTPDAWVHRISSVFDWPDEAPTEAALIVPCVIVGEAVEPVDIDLQALPIDVQLGTHTVRVLSADPSPDHPPRRRVVLKLPEASGSRRMIGPGSVMAKGIPADMSIRLDPDEERRLAIDVVIAEEPVLTFAGALVQVDGPWRLPLPIA